MVQEAARRLAGKGAVVQINTDENPVLARRFNISGIPAFHLIRREKSIATMSGGRDVTTILSWFQSHL